LLCRNVFIQRFGEQLFGVELCGVSQPHGLPQMLGDELSGIFFGRGGSEQTALQDIWERT